MHWHWTEYTYAAWQQLIRRQRNIQLSTTVWAGGLLQRSTTLRLILTNADGLYRFWNTTNTSDLYLIIHAVLETNGHPLYPVLPRPPICSLKKMSTAGIKNLANIRLITKKFAAKIQLITNNFVWSVKPKLKWLPTWVMYLLLLSVSLLLLNLLPSVITRSVEITRMTRFK